MYFGSFSHKEMVAKLSRRQAGLVAGFLFIVFLFGFSFFAGEDDSSLTGFVVLEDGVKVKTDKLDGALVEELKELKKEDSTTRVVVVLKEEPALGWLEAADAQEIRLASEERVLDDLGESTKIVRADALLEDDDLGFASESSGQLVDDASFSNVDLTITETFDQVSAFAGEVHSSEALIELTLNPDVEKIYLDYPLSTTLDKSTLQIHSRDFVNLSINGTLINGTGLSVCIVDTGIDYTHPALGGCQVTSSELTGLIENLSEPLETNHPYEDNVVSTFRIHKEGYTQMALHFKNISLEAPGSEGDTLDRVFVADFENRTIAVFKGDLSDVWTPAALGDTLYITLVTDGSITDYGFLVDQVINGSTVTSANWS